MTNPEESKSPVVAQVGALVDEAVNKSEPQPDRLEMDPELFDRVQNYWRRNNSTNPPPEDKA